MGLFALGSIDPLLVDRFSGFDLPPLIQRTRLLSDGGAGPFEVLQSSAAQFRTATVTGTIVESADIAALRAYDVSKEEVTFTDGNANDYTVRILELATEDLTYWWTFTMTIVDTGS